MPQNIKLSLAIMLTPVRGQEWDPPGILALFPKEGAPGSPPAAPYSVCGRGTARIVPAPLTELCQLLCGARRHPPPISMPASLARSQRFVYLVKEDSLMCFSCSNLFVCRLPCIDNFAFLVLFIFLLAGEYGRFVFIVNILVS